MKNNLPPALERRLRIAIPELVKLVDSAIEEDPRLDRYFELRRVGERICNKALLSYVQEQETTELVEPEGFAETAASIKTMFSNIFEEETGVRLFT